MSSDDPASEGANQGDNVKSPARKKVTGLGRGLSALLGDIAREEPLSDGPGRTSQNGGIRFVAIADIRPHPDQPRRIFGNEALDELAASIRQRGVIQPIVVRPMGNGYQIVAGERRWRAAQRARLHEIPAIIRDFDDAQAFEVAVVENIQREDLNVIEEAEAYIRLIKEYGHSQTALAELVGKSRSHVANLMRLLDLPEGVQQMVSDGTLTMGHARALINAPEPLVLARQVIKQGLSVRGAERLARKASGSPSQRDSDVVSVSRENGVDADIRAVENHLGDLLGLKVIISPDADKGSGTLSISYSNLDQLDLICQRLTGEHI